MPTREQEGERYGALGQIPDASMLEVEHQGEEQLVARHDTILEDLGIGWQMGATVGADCTEGDDVHVDTVQSSSAGHRRDHEQPGCAQGIS